MVLAVSSFIAYFTVIGFATNRLMLIIGRCIVIKSIKNY